MANDRKAEVVWHGNLLTGEGTIASVTSGALPPLPVSWASRSHDPDGKTSPEELIAAAHAACFAMALLNELADAGFTAETLSTSSTVSFEPGVGITTARLTVSGTVPGMSADDFHAAAEAAKAGCPVSKALAGVEISLDVL
jgi:osmotically inducible protein OsmC